MTTIPSPCEYAIIDLIEAVVAQPWTNGTILYFDDSGDVVGYGHINRLGDVAAELRVSFEPSGVGLLSPSPQLEDA